MVKEYWFFFWEDVFCRPIQVFSFQIDTGSHSPICCKPPRYGPHESEVMQNLVEIMDENSVVEEDDGPWGVFLVIATKPHQEHFHGTSISGGCLCPN